MDIEVFWFVLLGILLAGYAMLDGFDLGVGILHLAVRKDEERRILMNSIGPLWDGNEVWLVTFGGALFAAFPEAYASAFSGFYLPFMILLFALIFRGVSMEFRSKSEWRWWRSFWDVSFSAASAAATFLFGVAVGNSIQGLPINEHRDVVASMPDLLLPYPLLIGAFAVSVFALHGAIYLSLKTEGDLLRRVTGWMWRTFGMFVTLYMLTTIVTLIRIPSVARHFQSTPWAWGVVVLQVLAVANIPRSIFAGKHVQAFFSSCCTICALTFLFGIALYPNLIASSLDPGWNLTIYNSSSSHRTLGLMQVVAFCGMPFVLAYTIIIYRVFRGKVKIGKTSY